MTETKPATKPGTKKPSRRRVTTKIKLTPKPRTKRKLSPNAAAQKTSTIRGASKANTGKTNTTRTKAKSKTRTNAKTAKSNPNFTADAQKTMEDIMSTNKVQFDKITEESLLSAKESTQAIMESGSILVKGMESILQTMTNIIQDSSEKNAAAIQTIMKCNSINEFSEAQHAMAQQAFEGLMSNTAKLSEMSVKVCTDSVEPLNSQATKSMQKASESLPDSWKMDSWAA